MTNPESGHYTPAWRRRTLGERRWSATAASAVIAAITWASPEMAIGPRWLLPAAEMALLLTVVLANPGRADLSRWLRSLELSLLAVSATVIALSIGRVLHQIWTTPAKADGHHLLLSGAAIWVTNILFFALTYWQVDRGGPAARAHGINPYPGILFQQMSEPDLSPSDWESRFGDYLYLSFTNAAGFGPGDTIPLARYAKYLMMLQAASSLIIVVLIVSRAVNILA
ncbi:hypothetical protein [Actinoplanes sp. NPDC026619]|uniref:hypothetical protein n=1 Tax=Actinoplanes sp. NPDC026619 TaxID=3155798 RepID=UPI0033F02D20